MQGPHDENGHKDRQLGNEDREDLFVELAAAAEWDESSGGEPDAQFEMRLVVCLGWQTQRPSLAGCGQRPVRRYNANGDTLH